MGHGIRAGVLACAAVLVSAVLPASAARTVPLSRSAPAAVPVSPQTAPVRLYEPVIVTGQQFPEWSAGPEVTFRAPQPPTDYSVADDMQPLPSALRSDCYQQTPAPDVNGNVDSHHNDHNCYQHSQLPVRTLPGRTGVDPQSLRGYRWTGTRFEQVPFQVDTKWIHYITNNGSGFAFYSGVDQTLTYTFDREGFRFTTNRPFDPAGPSGVCWARPAGGQAATPDPNSGLIDTDEMVFMARDAGSVAPAGATLPAGIVDAHEVAVVDPYSGIAGRIYVMRSAKDTKRNDVVPPAFTAQNSPYVRYQRDANADLYVYSQSSYDNYGVAPKGPACSSDGKPVIGQGFKKDGSGHVVLDTKTFVQRRPLDNATITTPRYRFRYDGRWVMDDIRVSPDDSGLATGNYGPNLVDRWKARAFQQTPGGDTPCCGYEEEANNWGGSSQLMGERAGPVRIIRATWGADSSTNNVRTEIFYPEEIRYQDELRVHVIPPLDGIYQQRDMAAGRITRYYNPFIPNGVPVAGLNEEAFGNFRAHAGADGAYLDSQDTTGDTIRALSGGKPPTAGNPSDVNCPSPCIHGNFDVADPTFSGPPGELAWEETDGPWGAFVERTVVHQVTPVGTAAALVATFPYYRDDSCFDDGTGNDPGPKLHARSSQEPATWGYDPVTRIAVAPAPKGAAAVFPRRCWNHHADGTPYNIPGTLAYDLSKPAEASDPIPDLHFSPQGDIRYFQGDVGTHGLHIMLIADSDNAQMTVPIDEIDTEQRQVVLHGDQGNVGEQYGHSWDKPLTTVVTPYGGALPSAAGAAVVAPSTPGRPAPVIPGAVLGAPRPPLPRLPRLV